MEVMNSLQNNLLIFLPRELVGGGGGGGGGWGGCRARATGKVAGGKYVSKLINNNPSFFVGSKTDDPPHFCSSPSPHYLLTSPLEHCCLSVKLDDSILYI